MSTDVAARHPIIRHPYRFVAALEGLVLVVYLAAGTVAQVVGLPGLWLYAAANIACREAPGQRLRQGSWHHRHGTGGQIPLAPCRA